MSPSYKDLPGSEFISQGLQDLEKSLFTIPALLICIGRTRLENAGLKIPNISSFPKDSEFDLYALIEKEGHLDPYSYYNSLLRRLISFEQALEKRYFAKVS